MRLKSSLKWRWFIVIIVGIGFFSIIIFFVTRDFYMKPALITSNPNTQNLMAEKPIESVEDISSINLVSPGLPIRLNIPKINIDATLEHLGVTSHGAVDVPKGPSNAAWFNLGPRPGEIGSAVIVGHYGSWKNGSGSVFDNLSALVQGDKIYVEDENRDMITFVVRESRKYNPEADAPEVFVSNDGNSHLNLITCEGEWNKDSKSYSKRLVVFTDKE